ncbi:ribosomal protein L27 [Botrytis cinerea]
MLLPRLQPPLRGAITCISRTSSASAAETHLCEALAHLSFRKSSSPLAPLIAVRHASHAAQGAVNKAKDGPGKRLGAKKSGEQYVIPGNIIFRQRGTHWFPGENCAMGRDHTIYATQPGFVKYYKDPERHPKRQYIGVVFKREQVLPLPRNTIRRRRLGMEVAKIEEPEVEQAVEVELRPGYMYREANWEIGRAAERAKVKVRLYKPGDRWTAWRKANARKTKNAEKRGLSSRKKK